MSHFVRVDYLKEVCSGSSQEKYSRVCYVWWPLPYLALWESPSASFNKSITPRVGGLLISRSSIGWSIVHWSDVGMSPYLVTICKANVIKMPCTCSLRTVITRLTVMCTWNFVSNGRWVLFIFYICYDKTQSSVFSIVTSMLSRLTLKRSHQKIHMLV